MWPPGIEVGGMPGKGGTGGGPRRGMPGNGLAWVPPTMGGGTDMVGGGTDIGGGPNKGGGTERGGGTDTGGGPDIGGREDCAPGKGKQGRGGPGMGNNGADGSWLVDIDERVGGGTPLGGGTPVGGTFGVRCKGGKGGGGTFI